MLCACAAPPAQYERPLTTSVATLTTTLRGLNLASPVADLEINFQHGDYRLIGIYGYVCFPPGVAKEDYPLISRHGIRCFDGTSDGVESEQHMALMNQAVAYGAAYNRELVRRVREGFVFPNPAVQGTLRDKAAPRP